MKIRENEKLVKYILTFMHWGVIALSCLLITLISIDTLRNVSFLADKTYLEVQFWICLFFILDVIIDFIFSPKRLQFIIQHIVFFLISIPYLNIISIFGVDVSPELGYTLRFIPMVRAAYVLAIVTGAMQGGWARSMFSGYIILLVASLYFGSLMFYVEEHGVNPGLHTFWDSLWWGALNLTTTGCDITPVTSTGRFLAVMLSAEGLIMFPIFTVYLTNILTKTDNSSTPSAGSPTPDAGATSAEE